MGFPEVGREGEGRRCDSQRGAGKGGGEKV